MAEHSSLDVKCPKCKGTGLDTYRRACRLCQATGVVSYDIRTEWLRLQNRQKKELSDAQYRMFAIADNLPT